MTERVTGTPTVRVADPDELVAAGAVVAAAYRVDGVGGDGDYLEEVADAAGRAEHADVLVAVEDDGTVVGSVTYTLQGTPLAEVSRPGEAEFRMLGVAPSARGRGVGEALVLACIARAREDDASSLVLCTQDVSAAAHRLYERLGFERRPELDWTPIPGVDLRGYALPLTPRDRGGEARP